MVSATSLEMHAVSMSIVCYNLNLFLFEQNMIKNKIKSRYTQGTRPWVQSSRIAMATSCRKCSITLAAASPPGWPSTRPFWQAWREPDPCMSTTSLPNATRGFSSSRWFSVATTTSFVSPLSLSLSPPSQITFLDRASSGTKKERNRTGNVMVLYSYMRSMSIHRLPIISAWVLPAPNLSDKYEKPIDGAEPTADSRWTGWLWGIVQNIREVYWPF